MIDNIHIPNDVVTKLADLPDGSSVYEVGVEEEQDQDPVVEGNFHENLLENLPSSKVDTIASELLDNIENDKNSRKEWEDSYLKGFEYLGFKLEDYKNIPFINACRAFDTTLSTALIRFYSTVRAELFPQSGPAHTEILGNPTAQSEEEADRVKSWMNFYLTEEDPHYYPDSERMLMYLGMVGTVFRKVYQDPISKKPVARFIAPQNFIVNNDCVCLLESDRLTHVLYLTKKEIRLRQLSGFYADMSLKGINDEDDDETPTATKLQHLEGITRGEENERHLHKIFEVHANLNLEDEDNAESIPKPYIISICAANRQILSIRRNWHEGDSTFKRIEYFVQYNYLPGFGLYGIGLAQLLGSNAVVLTSLLRQLIDAGTLKNFPGGLKVKGMRIETNDKAIGPGEFWQVETGGLPIQQAVMPLPYSEPSLVLKELRNELAQQTQGLSSTLETHIAEQNQNAPVGTTLALLEVSSLVQSSIMRSLHVSLGRELQLLYDLFKDCLPNVPYQFQGIQKEGSISKEDFSHNVKIVPISDPSINTAPHRLLKAQALLQIASQAPQFYDMRKIHERVCQAMKVENLEEILPPPMETPPLDPIHENMNALVGSPVKAALWQDHEAHIMVHAPLAEQNPSLQAHIQEHLSMKYLVDMQLQMGIELPPLEQLQDPQIQNAIALQAAQIVKAQQDQLMAQQQQQLAAQQPAIDPSELMMADIAQKQQAAALKDKEAHLKAETEAFKAELKFQADQDKIEAQKEIADEKNKTALLLEQLKLMEKETQDLLNNNPHL